MKSGFQQVITGKVEDQLTIAIKFTVKASILLSTLTLASPKNRITVKLFLDTGNMMIVLFDLV